MYPDNVTETEDEALILDSIDRFLEREVAPYAHDLEARDEYPREIADKLAELGLYGATISPEHGGLGLSATTYAKIVERISAVWMSVSGIFNTHLIMAAAVERFGSDEMKGEFLPRFASGEIRGGIALTEPDCGTDLQAIRTRARRDGDDYVIDGSKMWITNSLEGRILAVLVKTDPDTDPPHKGMSLLLVEKEETNTRARSPTRWPSSASTAPPFRPSTAGSGFPPPPTPRSWSGSRRSGCRCPASSTPT